MNASETWTQASYSIYTWTHLRHELVGNSQQCRVCNMNAPETWTQVTVSSLVCVTWTHLRHELVGDGLLSLKVDLWRSQCSLQEQSQWQLSILCLDQRANRLMTELKYLLTLLVPTIILRSTPSAPVMGDSQEKTIRFDSMTEMIWFDLLQPSDWTVTEVALVYIYKAVIWHWFNYCVGLIL